jgi:heat-inducible transcriptional repressor
VIERNEKPGLEERMGAVLRAIIREHIATGEPVGSLTVARGANIDLSPATIRGIMAELEELELLYRPHASAGGVPTDLAYRLYVDGLKSKPQVAASQARAINEALGKSKGEMDELLGAASRQLSHFSNQVGIVLAPDMKRIIVEHLEFVRLDDSRIVAIIVGRSGVVHNRILRLDNPIDQGRLDAIGSYLSEEFRGFTLPRMRELLRSRSAAGERAGDDVAAASIELGSKALQAEESEAGLFVEGISNLIALPDFADLDAVRPVFKTLEEKSTLIDLLGRVLEGSGVQVVIGRENPMSDLARCSLVASNYGSGGRAMGLVGIVGPMRMQYARAIALVDYLAGILTKIMSNQEN